MASMPAVFLVLLVAGSQLTTGVSSEGINKAECNATKGCFFHPPGCDPMHDCFYALSYRPTQNNSVSFELSALVSGTPNSPADYVAVGFSHDQQMGKDAVTQCVFDKSGKVKVSLSYNGGKNNAPLAEGQKLDDEMISQVSGGSESMAGGKILLLCRFEQKVKSTMDDGNHVYDLSTPLYVLLASGQADVTKSVSKHTTNHADAQFPVVSPDQLSLLKVVSDSRPLPEQSNSVDHSQHGGGKAGIPEPEVFANSSAGNQPRSEPEHHGNNINLAQQHPQNGNNSAICHFASGTAVVVAAILSQIL